MYTILYSIFGQTHILQSVELKMLKTISKIMSSQEYTMNKQYMIISSSHLLYDLYVQNKVRKIRGTGGCGGCARGTE